MGTNMCIITQDPFDSGTVGAFSRVTNAFLFISEGANILYLDAFVA